MNRLASGLTAATIPLVIGLALAQSNEACLAVVFFVLAGIFTVVTIAPWLPLLNEVPVIGAPTVEMTIRANGSAEVDQSAKPGEIIIRVPKSDKDFEPLWITVELGIKNPTTIDVHGAMLNFGCSARLNMQFCD